MDLSERVALCGIRICAVLITAKDRICASQVAEAAGTPRWDIICGWVLRKACQIFVTKSHVLYTIGSQSVILGLAP